MLHFVCDQLAYRGVMPIFFVYMNFINPVEADGFRVKVQVSDKPQLYILRLAHFLSAIGTLDLALLKHGDATATFGTYDKARPIHVCRFVAWMYVIVGVGENGLKPNRRRKRPFLPLNHA